MKCPFLKQHLYTCQHCRILFLLTPPSVILPQDVLAEFMQTEFIKKNAPWISIGVTGLHSVMLLNCTIWLQSCSYKKCNLLFTKGPNPNMKVYVSQFMSMTIWWELIRRDTLMPVLVIHIDPPLTDSGLDVASLYRQTIHFPPASLPFLKTRNEQRSTSPDTMAESFCFCSATIQITEFLEQLVLKIVQSVQWHVTVLCNVCMISTRPQWGDRDHTASKSLNLTNRIFLSTKSEPFLLSISSNRYVSHRSFLQKKFWI